MYIIVNKKQTNFVMPQSRVMLHPLLNPPPSGGRIKEGGYDVSSYSQVFDRNSLTSFWIFCYTCDDGRVSPLKRDCKVKITDKAKRKELIRMRQKQILDVAAEVFSKNGYARADIDRYFKSKKKLFLSVVDRGIESLKDLVLEAMAKEKEPLDKIKKAMETYLQFFEEHSNLIGILIHEQSEFQKRIQKRYFDHYYEHINKMEEVFRQGIAKGQIKKIDVREAVGILTNMLNGLVYMWQIEGRKHPIMRKFPMLLKIYFTGIVGDKQLRRNFL
jgi:AcrR family transcriptional regulator